MRKNLGLILPCLILIALIFIVYFPITKTFYQQDEWLGYGLYLAKGYETIWQSTGGFLGIIFGQGRILTNLLYFLFYKYSPLNVLPISFFAITFHIVNTLIVFFLAKKLFRNILPAFLGSLFFALNSVSQSAVTWSAASINTLPSTTLILIALALYFKYLESFRGKWMILSFTFVYLSLFFKETGVFLFLLLPLFSLIYIKTNIRIFIKRYWYCLAAMFLIVIFRIWGFKSEPGQVALFLTGSSQAYWQTLLTRAVLYPLTSFSLTFVPSEPFLWFARSLSKIYYPFIAPQQFILIAQTVVLDLLALGLTFIIFILSHFLAMCSVKAERKHVGFFVGFMLFSFLPYIIISKNYAYLESRYYYLASVAWGIIFAWVANLVAERVKYKSTKLLFLGIFAFFLIVHAKALVSGIDKLAKESQTRIGVLDQILQIKPKLNGKKNIFYVTGDANYYLPDNKVPFQQGFGYTLLTWYGKRSEYPANFFDNTSLFEIGKEGYYEIGGYGFGYFSDLEKIKDEIRMGKFSEDEITAFYYSSKDQKILDIFKDLENSL